MIPEGSKTKVGCFFWRGWIKLAKDQGGKTMSVEFAIRLKKASKSRSFSAIPQGGEETFFQGINGFAIVLIHGLTGTPNEMRFLANFFHKQGYSVLCPRLANHGEPLEILKKSNWQDFHGSVREAFQKLKHKNEHKAIYAAGLSMGALLALLLADEFPKDVKAVSCLSPTLFYDGWNIPWSRHLLPLAYWTPLKNFFYFKEEAPYGIKNQRIREKIHRYYKDVTLSNIGDVSQFGYPYFPVRLLNEHRLLVKALTKKLGGIKIPVQIIQAKEDDTTSVKNAQFVYDRISSPIKEIVLLENSYHIITADQERAKVSHEILEFFRRNSGIPHSYRTAVPSEVLERIS